MYNLNTLMRNVLITPKEVLFHAQTKHSIDTRMIEQNIIVAEERFVRPELGFNLYDDIITEKNNTVDVSNKASLQALITTEEDLLEIGQVVNAYEFLSTAYLRLWKQHLWKIVAECVMVVSLPEGYIQFGSEGTMHTVPPAGLMVTSGFVTPLSRDLKWALDKKVQDRVAPLLQSMHNFLCKFKADYALYDKDCPCEKDVEGKQIKKTDLILSIYDDVDDNGRGCECGPR